MSSIPVIHNPPFAVDFQPFIDAKKVIELPLFQKVQNVVLRPFELIGFVFIALTQSGRTTLGYSWISFKHNVLAYYGSLSSYRPPQDFYLIIFKVNIWALKVFWCFTTTAFRQLIEQIDPPSKAFLSTYTEGKIDPSHLWTKELSIDVSAIPADIKVSTLRTIFQGINFSEMDKPGYMTPSSRTEGSIIYEVEDLRKSLETFIKHIEGRVPFLGTPPDYDTPRLMAFYQQIEDALRFSIHKINHDLEEFQNSLPGIPPDAYDEEQIRQYKNHLENLARIAIDMAIAGKHCGARYMGETMSTYFDLRGETGDNGTLQDCLIELLASKRSEIAQKHAHQHMGSDTHGLSKYMASLGEPLGLPGTRNIVEHLRKDFDYDKFLKLFFTEYTVNLIIDTVQEKIKKSQLFREKITDWLKDQVADWKKDSEHAQELTEEIQTIIDKKDEVALPWESQKFEKLITYLREQKVEWPLTNKWNDFIDELLTLDVAKQWFKIEFEGLPLVERQTKKNQIKQKFNKNILGKEAAQRIKNAIIHGEPLPLDENESKQQKINIIRRILPLIQQDTLSRVLEGKVNLETAIRDHLDLARREEFLHALRLDDIAEEGIYPEILEWLLVSQQILLPQKVNEEVENAKKRGTIASNDQFIQTVVEGFIESRQNGDVWPLTWVQEHLFNLESSQKEVDGFAEKILLDFRSSIPKNDSKRYQFNGLKPSDELLKVIFEESFHHASQPVIRDAQRIEGSFYPLWKRVCWIKVPKNLGAFFGNFLVKVAISVAAIYYTYKLGNFAFKGIEYSFTAKVIPFVINNTPITIIRSSNQILKAIDWGLKHKFRLLLGAFGVQQIILWGPNIPYFTSTIRAINIWDMGWALYRSPQTLGSFLFYTALDGALFTWKSSRSLGALFSSVAIKAESEFLAISKSKSYAVWKAIIAEKTLQRWVIEV